MRSLITTIAQPNETAHTVGRFIYCDSHFHSYNTIHTRNVFMGDASVLLDKQSFSDHCVHCTLPIHNWMLANKYSKYNHQYVLDDWKDWQHGSTVCSAFGKSKWFKYSLFWSMLILSIFLQESEYGSVSTLLFAATAIIAAITVLFSPETFSKKLPDTIKEAECLWITKILCQLFSIK